MGCIAQILAIIDALMSNCLFPNLIYLACVTGSNVSKRVPGFKHIFQENLECISRDIQYAKTSSRARSLPLALSTVFKFGRGFRTPDLRRVVRVTLLPVSRAEGRN